MCVTLVRQTETQLLARGRHVLPLAQAVPERLHRMAPRSEDQRARLEDQRTAALEAHQRIAYQSRRLTPGKALPHGTIVNAYDPTIAPICKGQSHGPAQLGRKPGIIAEPAAGVIFALQLPVGHPSDASDVKPLGAHVEAAIARVRTRPTPAIHALAGDLALHDAAWREVLQARGMLTVGIPTSVDPLPPSPTAADILRSLDETDVHRRRTPGQVPLAYACGAADRWSKASWPACGVVEQGASPTKAIAARSFTQGWRSWRTMRRRWCGYPRIVGRSARARFADGCVCEAVNSSNAMPQ